MQMLLSLHSFPSSPCLCFYLFNRKRIIVCASLLFVSLLLLLLLLLRACSPSRGVQPPSRPSLIIPSPRSLTPLFSVLSLSFP